MSTAYSLLPDEPPPPGAVFAGKVSRASPVQVTLDGYSDMHEWPGGSQAATWMTPSTPPVRGARALVFIDDQGGLWAFGAPA